MPRRDKGKAANQRTRTERLGRGAEFLPALTVGATTQKRSKAFPNAICPECKAEARVVKAIDETSGQYGRVEGIKKGDPIFSPHRPGGGVYSMKRGDLLCKGVGLPVPHEED